MGATDTADGLKERVEELQERTSLSDQEAEIQARREQGQSPTEIADELDISRSQVSVALDRISQKQQQAEEMSTVLAPGAPPEDGGDGTILPEGARPRQQPQVFLAPCVNDHAQRHFQDTVIDRVNVDDPAMRSIVPSRYQSEVPIWGTGEGNRSAAEAMEPGDVLLFYVGDNTYSHYAVVEEVEENAELAEELWTPYGDTIREDQSENWPWVMYLSDPVEVNIDSESLHDIFGWSQSYPLGFTRVAEHRVDHLETEFGSVQQYLSQMLVEEAAKGEGEVPTVNMTVEPTEDPKEGSDPSLEELRKRAKASSTKTTTGSTTTTTRYSRSQAVRDYVLAQADGICEACEEPAPFEKPNGDPYLETHHVFRVSDEGMDDPDVVAAICPTCHRRIHHGQDGNEYNKQLIETLREKRGD